MGTGAFAVWMDVGRASLAREEVWQHPSPVRPPLQERTHATDNQK